MGIELYSGVSFWQRRAAASWAVQEDSQMLERNGGCFPLSGTCGTSSGVVCPVLGSPVQERH